MHAVENQLLSALPPPERARLAARMTDVTLASREFVYQSGGPLDYVYFPYAGMLSAVVVMADGATAEAAAIGHEGMAGLVAAFGGTRSAEQVFCQVAPCQCRRLPAAEFAEEAGRGGPLRGVVHRYLRGVLAGAARQAACNCLHPNDERLATWLLRCRDATRADEFFITHEFVAAMLGVRRATVTVTAGTLQSAGLISYRHGRVRIVDPAALEQAACECYAATRALLEPAG